MTIGKCVEVLGYLTQVARLSTEVAQYVSEPKENPLTPVSSKLNTIPKYAILALEALKIFSTDDAMKKRVLGFEMSAGAVKALSHLAENTCEPGSVASDVVFNSFFTEINAIHRNAHEYGAAVLRGYLDLSDEELAKIQWPVYECEGSGELMTCRHVGYKTKTKDDLKSDVKFSDTTQTILGLVETALRGVATYTYLSQPEHFERGVVVEVIDPAINGGAVGPHVVHIDPAAAIDLLGVVERNEGPESMFDFIKFARIPEELHNDPVLSAYTDPITLAPIRYAVTHRLHPQVHYDSLSIHKYILRTIAEGRPVICPMTRSPLRIEDVIVDEATQNIIDTRLNKLSTSLKQQFAAAIEAAAMAVAE